MEVTMTRTNTTNWRLDRRISLSVLIQLMVLASMILASWVNLQRQLDSLQHDVTTLLASQKEFQQKLEQLSSQGLSCEYRLQAVERRLGDTVPTAIR
jgi:Tfp pilus assembly protein PilO